jgi:hypothetical protein
VTVRAWTVAAWVAFWIAVVLATLAAATASVTTGGRYGLLSMVAVAVSVVMVWRASS